MSLRHQPKITMIKTFRGQVGTFRRSKENGTERGRERERTSVEQPQAECVAVKCENSTTFEWKSI